MKYLQWSVFFVFGFAAGFGTLLALFLVYGDYGAETVGEPATLVAGVTATETPVPLPSATPSVTPTATPTPLPVAPAPTPTPLPTWTPPPPGLNTDVVVSDILWRVMAVEELGNTLPGDEFTSAATTPGKFVRVQMMVENRRGEPQFYEAPDLADAQGRRYRAYSERFYYMSDEEDCTIRNFNPNLIEACTEIFEVAADAGGYKLIVNDFEAFDPAEATIELR